MSAGHGSALLYSVLHLLGYQISATDLEQFRQLAAIRRDIPNTADTRS